MISKCSVLNTCIEASKKEISKPQIVPLDGLKPGCHLCETYYLFLLQDFKISLHVKCTPSCGPPPPHTHIVLVLRLWVSHTN